MNKKEMIVSISKLSGLSRPAAKAALNAFILSTSEALCCGDKVVLSGFGSLSVKDRAARPGRNVSTGEAIDLPAGKAVRFRVSNRLKQAVNNKEG